MRENRGDDVCARCKRPLDPERDHYVAVVETSIDVQTSHKERDEIRLCTDCGFTYFDVDPSSSSKCSEESEIPLR